MAHLNPVIGGSSSLFRKYFRSDRRMTEERARRANHWFACPVPFAKIFWFTFDPNHLFIFAIPAQYGGAFRDRHERRAGDAMDAEARSANICADERR
jgi:hypothetical protein